MSDNAIIQGNWNKNMKKWGSLGFWSYQRYESIRMQPFYVIIDNAQSNQSGTFQGIQDRRAERAEERVQHQKNFIPFFGSLEDL